MFGSIFYHNLTKKYITVFGNMFDTITIRRFNAAKQKLQSIQVPLSYGPSQKYIKYLLNPPEDRKISTTLPRMSFAMMQYSIDAERKVGTTQKRKHFVSGDKKSATTSFVETPYKLEFELYIYGKNQDDCTQIIEQIIPYFNPTYTNSVNVIPELGTQGNYDVQTTLNSIMLQDEYEGNNEETRFVVYTVSFTMDVFFFGPVSTTGVIKRVQTDIAIVKDEPVLDTTKGRNIRLTTTPGLTEDGEPTTDYELSIPYQEIEENDPYGFVHRHEMFFDGKKFDPKSGTDK